jgi:ABC-type uncharacterized transport system permease subunit
MKNLNQWSPEFNISISLAASIILAAAGFIAAFVSIPTLQEEIKFSAAIISAAAAIYSAYYVGMPGNGHKQRRETHSSTYHVGNEAKDNTKPRHDTCYPALT